MHSLLLCQMVKQNLTECGDPGSILLGRSLQKKHTYLLFWKIPWMRRAGKLHPMEPRRVRYLINPISGMLSQASVWVWFFAALWTKAWLGLLCPWTSPGNTAVSCHAFTPQGSSDQTHVSLLYLLHLQTFTTSATWEAQAHFRGSGLKLIDCSLSDSSIHGISKNIELAAIHSLGGFLLNQRSNLGLLHCSRFIVWATTDTTNC